MNRLTTPELHARSLTIGASQRWARRYTGRVSDPSHQKRGAEAALIQSGVPGPRSLALAKRLARVESPNVTALDSGNGAGPIFWERAFGANVWDVDGNRFVDLTAAFGVAGAGHAHPDVVDAICEQSGRLLHGMGDVHPSALKVELLEALCALYPGGATALGVLSSSGSDAVESALKSAMLYTGKAGVIAFQGAYHGLAFGALDTTWREDFKRPFAARLPGRTHFAPFGDLAALDAIDSSDIGAVLVEPIQGRGGERVPADGFLRGLAEFCKRRGLLLIADEIYTGFGRTGTWFACDREGVIPDLLCVGKGLSSGMPLSACLGRREVMGAWPVSAGEAIHTQTFLGHPASCAAALASLRVLREEKALPRSRDLGERALRYLRGALAGCETVTEVRGLGLMIGIECAPGVALRVCRDALERGTITLPSGDHSQVLSITPPLLIDEALLLETLETLVELFAS